jgi:hypothetical protein
MQPGGEANKPDGDDFESRLSPEGLEDVNNVLDQTLDLWTSGPAD